MHKHYRLRKLEAARDAIGGVLTPREMTDQQLLAWLERDTGIPLTSMDYDAQNAALAQIAAGQAVDHE